MNAYQAHIAIAPGKAVSPLPYEPFNYLQPHKVTEYASEHGYFRQLGLTPIEDSDHIHSTTEDTDIVILCDARIDNRKELCQKFSLRSSVPDQTLITKAYLTFGESMVQELLGDFSIVVYDGRRRKLLMVSDYLGSRPLYYFFDGESCTLSSELYGLSMLPHIPDTFSSKDLLRSILFGFDFSDTDTTFTEIKKVPSGSIVSIDASGIKVRRYWSAQTFQPVEHRSLAAYIEYGREVLTDAVRQRLLSPFPVASQLSGGLDSSVITLLANQIKSPEQQLFTYGWLPGESEEGVIDEWNNSQRIIDQTGLPFEVLEVSPEQWYLHEMNHNTLSLGRRFNLTEQENSVYAQRTAIRTILSGWGGDQLISNKGGTLYYTSLKSGRLGVMFQALRHDLKKSGRPLKQLKKLVYNEILMYSFFGVNQRRSTYLEMAGQLSPLLGETAQIMLQQMLASEIDARPRVFARGIDSGEIRTRIISHYLQNLHAGVEYRYPLLDRRISELALSLPLHYYRHNGIKRYYFRELFKELLPEEVYKNERKSPPRKVIQERKVRTISYEERVRHALRLIDMLYDEMDLQWLVDRRALQSPYDDGELKIGAIALSRLVYQMFGLRNRNTAFNQLWCDIN